MEDGTRNLWFNVLTIDPLAHKCVRSIVKTLLANVPYVLIKSRMHTAALL